MEIMYYNMRRKVFQINVGDLGILEKLWRSSYHQKPKIETNFCGSFNMLNFVNNYRILDIEGGSAKFYFDQERILYD